MVKTEMKAIILKVEKEKEKIAKARDSIRKLYDDLGDLVECFDTGEGLDSGIREITDAVDKISEVV